MRQTPLSTRLKASLGKEWIKLRFLGWLPLLLLAAILLEIRMSFAGYIAAHGPASLWQALVYKQVVLFERLEWVFVASGLLLACLQYLPECTGRRLRLLFHMPVSHRLSLHAMAFVGLLSCLALGALGYLGLWLVVSEIHLPPELKKAMCDTMLPWILSSLVAYFTAAAAIAEPSWPRKLAVVFVGVGYLYLLSAQAGFAGMQTSLPYYILICLPWPVAFEAAALRVKEGKP